MKLLTATAIAVATIILLAPPAHAATAAGAGIEVNGKYIGGFTITWDGETREDHHPLIRKDAESILFLKNTGTEKKPEWAIADYWFGIQWQSPWMLKSIVRLKKDKD